MDKIRVIKRSLRCFTSGWFGLVPILGIPVAFRAIILYRQVQAEMRSLPYERLELGDTAVYRDLQAPAHQPWNPAQVYASLGCTLACSGLIFSLLSLGGICLLLVRAILQ